MLRLSVVGESGPSHLSSKPGNAKCQLARGVANVRLRRTEAAGSELKTQTQFVNHESGRLLAGKCFIHLLADRMNQSTWRGV